MIIFVLVVTVGLYLSLLLVVITVGDYVRVDNYCCCRRFFDVADGAAIADVVAAVAVFVASPLIDVALFLALA